MARPIIADPDTYVRNTSLEDIKARLPEGTTIEPPIVRSVDDLEGQVTRLRTANSELKDQLDRQVVEINTLKGQLVRWQKRSLHPAGVDVVVG
jgi:predicted RNase H-like nuclease (RuvC/YqgF family)